MLEIIDSLPPFNWNAQPDVNDGRVREVRPVCVLENGAVYEGEWLQNEN